MPLSLNKRPSRTVVGLDVDRGYLAAAETSGGRIMRAVSAELEPGLIAEGEVAEPEGLAAALRTFFRSADLPPKVRLGVANQQVAVRTVELPRIDDEDELSMAVRFQAGDAIAMPIDEAILDYQVVGESEDPAGPPRMRVVIVAARESMVAALVDAARSAGLKPQGVDVNAFALVRALAGGSAAEGARVYCHLAGVVNLAVAQGSSCLFTRPLPVQRGDAGEPLAAPLAEEIRLSIDFYMAQPEAVSVGDVLLSGPGSVQEGLAEEVAGLINMPVAVATPPAELGDGRLAPGEDPQRHTVAVGLAMGAVDDA